MIIFYAVTLMIIPISMIGFGSLWKKNSPKEINYGYGYRTTRSMKNADTWEFAHKYMAKIWPLFGKVMTVGVILLTIILFIIKADKDTQGNIILVATALEIIGGLVYPIFLTEKALKQNFDENGVPTNKTNV